MASILFRKGKANLTWKRGFYKTKKGYLRISAGPHRGKYIHRVVAEAAIQETYGRPLKRSEEVHHLCNNRECSADFHLLILDEALHHGTSPGARARNGPSVSDNDTHAEESAGSPHPRAS
jgi:hypothetical protein